MKATQAKKQQNEVLKRKIQREEEAEEKKKPIATKQIEMINNNQESDSDDTDDEIIKARIGKIPWKWYDNYKHFGYDSDLKKIQRQKQEDKIDEFIKKAENPDWWKTVRDELNQQDIVLTDE